MIIVNCEQGSPAWFAERCGRFTASKFSTLMSGKATIGYKDLIIETAGEILTGEVEETYTNAAMERGKELEPEARREFEGMAHPVTEVGFCLPDDEEITEWVGVSPDGILPDGGLLEIKCPYLKTHLNYIKANKLPTAYKWQVHGQLFVTGAPYAYFMSYYPKLKPFVIKVYPDRKMIQELKTRLIEAISEVKIEIEKYNNYEPTE